MGGQNVLGLFLLLFWVSTFLKSEKHFHLGLKVSLIAKTLEVCQENPSPTNVGDIV